MSEPASIRLQVGEEHLVPLSGLGSAGYVWDREIGGADPEAVGVQIEPMDVAMPAGQLGGHSVDYTARIRAVRPGSVTVNFLLRRPWERGVGPIRKVSLSVEVNEPP
jgi:predicted secreted protein